jgi:indole-3-glycerol phosphate synthase
LNILDKIVAYKQDEVASGKLEKNHEAITKDALAADPVRSFAGAIENKIAARQFALIAEIKKASPSKGLIRKDFDPPALATAYEQGGAACLSVLTDEPSFHGSPDYLIAARNSVSLPVLRKDFMIDPWQVTQSRAWGADCILIIMAAVDDVLAAELNSTASDWKMDVLLEVHNEEEMERALQLDAQLIGINNRNLKTFATTLTTTETLAQMVPEDRIIVSESGISSHADLIRLSRQNTNTFLVGESLMREKDLTNATRKLLNGTP